MGCDGYLKKPFESTIVNLTCHVCSRPIYSGRPITGHEHCLHEIMGEEVLKMNVEIHNYEER